MPPRRRVMMVEAFAPAKVNLTLHVTGRRADGYHLLDSLVVFADLGDRLRAGPGEGLALELCGARADGVPAGEDNLVLRAARLMRAGVPGAPGARLTLDKHLPAAAGLGGGSADAAAAIRALARLWGRPLPVPADLLALGADLPVCLESRPARMSGIGERLSAPPPLPPIRVVLVNPGQEVATGAVFSALGGQAGPAMPAQLPAWRDAAGFADWLATMRNDLEAPARKLCPAIDEVLAALSAQPGCLLARMSGSGASCFGLFASAADAGAAERALAAHRPQWWVRHGSVLSTPPALAEAAAEG